MFWYVMLMLFSPLHLLFRLVCRGEQARLAWALHHRVLILPRQLGKRPSLVPIERLALVLPSPLLERRKLTEALLFVKPETLVASGDRAAALEAALPISAGPINRCGICRRGSRRVSAQRARSWPARCWALPHDYGHLAA